ncbi:hypothetical protein [Rhizobium giardinii]|uniref:hypothetical protein n=1 Tax=Rhizobium giardinii TaxID=56731 RepID=UPI003D6FE356
MPKDFLVTVLSIRSPRWADAQHTAIDCWARFDHIDEEVPFTARASDVEPHGVDIFIRCAAGEFGDIQEYEPPALSTENLASVPFQMPEAWPDADKFLQDANLENANGTDRGCVLVWTSMIDELLRRILEAFLVSDDKRASEFFSHNGPAGSFSGRTKLAYFMGLITDDELRIIDKLRDIRNDFAHQYGVSLADASYAGRCEYLYKTMCGDGVRFPPRLQFTSACGSLLPILIRRYENAKASKRELLIDGQPLYKR